ncbi:MAG: hypothetical protein AB4080_25855 [Trichodesmium sp.]
MERWRDGEMERWKDGKMGRWGDDKTRGYFYTFFPIIFREILTPDSYLLSPNPHFGKDTKWLL